MIEGSGSGSIPLTNGSGSGSMRPKNMWIRIRNTAFGWLARPSGSRSSSLSSRPLNTLPYSPLLSVKLRKILVSYKRGGYRLKDFKIKLAGQNFCFVRFRWKSGRKVAVYWVSVTFVFWFRTAELWIRNHWSGSGNGSVSSISSESGSNLDPEFWWPKSEENKYSWNSVNLFLIKNLLIPRPP